MIAHRVWLLSATVFGLTFPGVGTGAAQVAPRITPDQAEVRVAASTWGAALPAALSSAQPPSW